MQAIRAKKSLGQHFLVDRNIARKIVDSLPLPGEHAVLEIGPGTGILTGMLLNRYGSHLTVVEIDREASDILEKEFPELTPHIIREDFLRWDWEHYYNKGPVGIIGNLPYNISSQIFFRLLDLRDQVPCMVCMVQKEVAERIASGPGTKDYGILSVLLQAYFRTEYLFTVGEKVFAPPPKVKSAVLRITRLEKDPDCQYGKLKLVVKTAFNQRRKMLRNSLSGFDIPSGIGQEVSTKRPEQLSVEDFVRLARCL